MKRVSQNIYFIAEIGVNHEGNLKKAFKCIKLAREGGASAVKFQCYKAEKIASKFATSYWDKSQEREDSQFKLFKKFDKLDFSDYQKIFNYCKKIKIDFIITPFDLDSVDFFKNKVKYFKVSSSDITNFPLLQKIAATKKPVILSTGASTNTEINSAIKILKKGTNKIVILHCILNYPTKKHNVNLNMIEDLKKYNFPVGLSDHTLPKDSHKVLEYAYLKGVKFYEKHFTFDKKKRGNDHYHSFNKKDLILFLKNIKEINSILGSNKKKYLKSEIVSRLNARRSIFLNNNLRKGQKINPSNLIMLRPAIGISPSKIKKVLNKRLKKNKKKGEILKFSEIF